MGDELRVAALQRLEAPDRGFVPSCADIVVDGLDPVEKPVSQPTLVVLGQGECFLEKLLGRVGHDEIVNREA